MQQSYSDKLLDPRWQKKRLEILQRDEWICQICNSSKKTLHVHHLIYIDGLDPWDYEDKFLLTLCSVHHDFAHKAKMPHQHISLWCHNKEKFPSQEPETLGKLFVEFVSNMMQQEKL